MKRVKRTPIALFSVPSPLCATDIDGRHDRGAPHALPAHVRMVTEGRQDVQHGTTYFVSLPSDPAQ